MALQAAQVPFLVGGGHALSHYTGIIRHTKDFDIFVYLHHCAHALEVLHTTGYYTEMTFPHWLGKACSGPDCIDVIFSSGNCIATVDEAWFAHAVAGNTLGIPMHFCPPEEMLWSKSYVMERERYDGADIVHLLHACSTQFDWYRLLERFRAHWRVLLNYLILFGFVCPGKQSCIPTWVMQDLLDRLQHEVHHPPPGDQICQGTLLSRAQYLIGIECWGYRDARLRPTGLMTAADIAHWTAAISEEEMSTMTTPKEVVRVAALGDLHYPKIPQEVLQGVLTQATKQADVLLLCGDLTDYGQPDEAQRLAQACVTYAKIPTLGVLGNHDYQSGQHEEVWKILCDAGIIMLDGRRL